MSNAVCHEFEIKAVYRLRLIIRFLEINVSNAGHYNLNNGMIIRRADMICLRWNLEQVGLNSWVSPIWRFSIF